MTITVGSTRIEGRKDFLRKQRQAIDERLNYWLDVALGDSFPCSDPISSMRTD
jgi:putative component of toxin-antitoxin plasmid stabilization module